MHVFVRCMSSELALGGQTGMSTVMGGLGGNPSRRRAPRAFICLLALTTNDKLVSTVGERFEKVS
jgi:hypothetical protein